MDKQNLDLIEMQENYFLKEKENFVNFISAAAVF